MSEKSKHELVQARVVELRLANPSLSQEDATALAKSEVKTPVNLTPNALRVLQHVEGMRRLVEAVHGAEKVAAAVGKNPKQTEDDDIVALYRDIAYKYGEAMVLAELQQTPDVPSISSVREYKDWAIENSEGNETLKSENARLREKVDSLGAELGRLRGTKSR